MLEETTKICSKCKDEFSITYFSKCSTTKDKLRPECKRCANIYTKDWYSQNKNKIKQYQKDNNKSIKTYQQQYRKLHKDHMRNYNKVYQQKNALFDIFAPQIDFCEEVKRDSNNQDLLQVKCTEINCKKWFNPTTQQTIDRIKALKNKTRGELRFYCSDSCKQKCSIYGQVKYPKDFKPNYSRGVQSELRELVLERDDYECQKCSNTNNLECHHFDGILYEPLLSADMDECITLCKDCHKDAHKDIGCRYVDLKCE